MKKALSLLLTIILFSCGIIIAEAADDPARKITPALQDALDQLGAGDTVSIIVYFDESPRCISDMPDWDPSPDASYASTREASIQHAEYLADHNAALVRQIFASCENYPTYYHKGKLYYTEVNCYLDGCCVAREITPDNLSAICASPLVRSFDLYADRHNGKISPELDAVLNAVAPDDYITVDIWRKGYFKSVDEMPSWPASIGTREETDAKFTAAREEYAVYRQEIEEQFFGEAFDGIDDVRYLYRGGNLGIVAVKAGDIAAIASRACVSDVNYFYNAIAENESGGTDPVTPNSKLDASLIGKLEETKDISTYLPVYIELDIDTQTIKDMPSYPDVQKAEWEYDRYFGTLSQQYNEALDALKAITRLEEVRYICCDALTAKVTNELSVLNSLAENEHVKSISYFTAGDAWQTDHSRYDSANTVNRYRDRFVSQYHAKLDPYSGCNLYQELLYHPCADGNKAYACDWALVMGSYGTVVACAEYQQVVGGRLLWAPSTYQAPFAFDIGIYDAEQDRFFDITEIDFDSYDGLYEIWQSLDIGTLTEKEQAGDADGDMEVTILDATRIQRYEAALCSKNDIVATGADADGDGTVTILDATRIQRYKAELCNLDGTPFTASGQDDYEIGSLLVKASTGDPRSLSRARSAVLSALDGFEIESIGLLASAETSATFKVTLVQKTAETDRLAITALEQNDAIITADPYRGEYSTHEPDHFEPGAVLVSGDFGGCLSQNGIEVESTRLLTPGSNLSVYCVYLKEKSKEIVWRAMEILENCGGVKYAEPNFYGTFDV